jgi:uncharacterized membrane protein
MEQVVKRGAAGYGSPATEWSAQETWPTSKQDEYFAFCSPCQVVSLFVRFCRLRRHHGLGIGAGQVRRYSSICLLSCAKLFSSTEATLHFFRRLRGVFILLILGGLAGAGVAAQTPPSKKSAPIVTVTPAPPPAPNAPQSTHYPILLLASGESPNWSLRIGPKGPELLQRQGYPSIALDPAEITREGTAEMWVYRAKDSAANADLAVQLMREPCTDPSSQAKYTFRAVVTHSLIGKLEGCARIAAELFPRAPGQTAQADDDVDTDKDKKKPPVIPPITNAKAPVAVAYLTAAGKVFESRGAVKKVAAPAGAELALSHDGKKLLYAREDAKDSLTGTIVLYEFETGRARDLVHGAVGQAFWSPDDSRIAYVNSADQRAQVWVMTPDVPDKAVAFATQTISSLHGWVDAHTVLASDAQSAYWLSEDKPQQAVSLREIYGEGFTSKSSDTVRLNPMNPDLLLVSAAYASPPVGAPTDSTGTAYGMFLYELRSRRRSALSPPDQYARHGEWSRDGLQVYYTRRISAAASAIFRIFWDGSGLRRYAEGSDLVIGQ